MREYAEIGCGGITFDSPDTFHRVGVYHLPTASRQLIGGPLHICVAAVVADKPTQDVAVILNFRSDEQPAQVQCVVGIVGALILCFTQQHIAFVGPCERLINRPCGDKNVSATPLSAHSFINPGLAPIYPNVTICSMLWTGIRNISFWFTDITTFKPSLLR